MVWLVQFWLAYFSVTIDTRIHNELKHNTFYSYGLDTVGTAVFSMATMHFCRVCPEFSHKTDILFTSLIFHLHG